MLSSSNKYLQALRAGNYLRFLEWPHFIAEHYKGKDGVLDADSMLDLLVFEWINNGFCDEDVKKMAVLNAVNSLESNPITGHLAYSLMSLTMSVYQCLVYKHCDLLNQLISKDKMNKGEIIGFLKQKTLSLDESTFKQHLKEQQSQFDNLVSLVDLTTIEDARSKISAIADLRYILLQYILSLEQYIKSLVAENSKNDELKETRCSLAISLSQYLNDQTELTAEVSEEIAKYVQKIRERQPADFEEEYLQNLSPRTLVESTWQFVKSISLSIFSSLQKPTPTLNSAPLAAVK